MANVLVDRARRAVFRAGWTAMRVGRPAPRQETVLSDRGAEGESFVRLVREPVVIEPTYGYMIRERGGLVEDGLAYNFEYKAPWRVDIVSPRLAVATWRDRMPTQDFDVVVSMRHLFEWNYYHFHNDVLGELAMIDAAGIGEDVPLVVGDFPNKLRFAREILSTGRLARRNWVVQDGFAVRAAQAYHVRVLHPHMRRLDHLLDLMGVPAEGPTDDTRVFLTRRPPENRLVLNAPEVEDLLASYGFDVVDTAGMAVSDQIELFRHVRHLVAIHGAGITNVVHRRRRPLSVIELRGGWGSSDFRKICEQNGYDHRWHDGVYSGPRSQHASFSVDCAQLERDVRAMLDAAAAAAPPRALARAVETD